MRSSARLLLEAAPNGVDISGIEKDVASLEGVEGVHEIHVFSLSELTCFILH